MSGVVAFGLVFDDVVFDESLLEVSSPQPAAAAMQKPRIMFVSLQFMYGAREVYEINSEEYRGVVRLIQSGIESVVISVTNGLNRGTCRRHDVSLDVACCYAHD
jgi:hypothetical protein